MKPMILWTLWKYLWNVGVIQPVHRTKAFGALPFATRTPYSLMSCLCSRWLFNDTHALRNSCQGSAPKNVVYDVLYTAEYIISYLGMKSWDLHVCDCASTTTHVDRVKKSNPWYNKIWLCFNVTIWSSQISFSVIFIHFVMIQNIWEKNCTYSHFFQSPVTASAYFW